MIHADTTFLVDLLREQRRGTPGPASAYLDRLPDDDALAVSVHVVCELMAGAHAAGAPTGEMDRLGRLCEALVVRYPDERFAAAYGRLVATVRSTGATVDTMDLLIATAAILDRAPLATRNARHFSKVPGLTVEQY
ncbi:MAG: type II toxin-antitoxin system VapC family toxin [Acidobacteriota bacterium]